MTANSQYMFDCLDAVSEAADPGDQGVNDPLLHGLLLVGGGCQQGWALTTASDTHHVPGVPGPSLD